jgi:adenosylcobinamide kinase/adenosylcobinamide-phosphate guanylyltransferase
MIHFILGGARSGKSSFAEQQALVCANKAQLTPIYVATATNVDNEMSKRIAKHQVDRDNRWQLIECPLALAELLSSKTHLLKESNNLYLIDCMTLWLNNILYQTQSNVSTVAEQEEQIKQKITELLTRLQNSAHTIFIVSNEVGLGVIPMGETTRLFVDYCGWLNQGIAQIANKVTLVTVGIPQLIKG